MARTRRRHSYRKSRRWNPDAVPAAATAAAAAAPTKTNPRRKGKRNPHTFVKRLGDGSKVSVTPQGKVTVLDTDGSVHDQWSIAAYEVPYLLRNLKVAERADKYDFRADRVTDEYRTVRQNPRRKGRKAAKRGHRGHTKKARGRGKASSRTRGKPGRRVSKSWSKHRHAKPGTTFKKRGRSRSRSNPAQFPAPYFSAMANPRRSKKRSARGRTRRNSPIKRKDARALKRVLRTHHYSCR